VKVTWGETLFFSTNVGRTVDADAQMWVAPCIRGKLELLQVVLAMEILLVMCQSGRLWLLTVTSLWVVISSASIDRISKNT
jgi:hypothetical protein